MVSLIFEKKYAESCYGGASMTLDQRYVITENPDYPRGNHAEKTEPDQENSSWLCVDRSLEGEFDSAESARAHVLQAEKGYLLGDSIERQLSRYPESLILGYAPYGDIEALPEGWAIHVPENAMSPFWFSNQADADEFLRILRNPQYA